MLVAQVLLCCRGLAKLCVINATRSSAGCRALSKELFAPFPKAGILWSIEFAGVLV